MIFKKRRFSATQIILVGFLVIILSGALLLTIPIARAEPELGPAPFKTALFTAVSATCVTGLVIEDTATYWSVFGQIVILSMIQIGGLGFMTLAVMMSVILKRKITPRERIIFANSLNLNSYEGVVKRVKHIVLGTILVELIGATMLSIRFIPIFGFADGVYKGIFHSVSAFCNAGFDLMGGYSGKFSSITAFADDVIVNITIMLLIIIGGIGFIVWEDILNLIKHRKRMSVYSKFVIVMTLILVFGGAAAILIFEWSNPATIGNMPLGDKIIASMFQSVTPRTAGFNSIDLNGMRDITKLLFLVLMFIGGASGSTAGGVKVATFGLVLYTVLCVSRGKTDVVMFKRKISNVNTMRALSILVIQLIICILGSGVLLSVDGVYLMEAMFEAFSASGTVGLSLSLTPALPAFCHVVLMFMMYFGRVGILTVTYAITMKIASTDNCVSYAETHMYIG